MAEEDTIDDGFQLVRSKHKDRGPVIDQLTLVVFLDTSNSFDVLSGNVGDGMDAGVPKDGSTQIKALGAIPHPVL